MMKQILGMTTALCSLAAVAAHAEDLIVNSYGGPYKDIIHQQIIKPFEEKFGINVIYDANGSSSQDYAKIKATNGNPGWDVNVMTAAQSLAGCADDLLVQMTEDNVPNLAFLDAGVRDMAGACGAVHEVQYMSLLWRTDKMAPQTTWNVLGNPELKGKILLPKFSNIMSVYLMQVFSKMAGGDLENIDKGFEKLAELAPQALSFEKSSAIMGKYVREGQVLATPFWSGRAQLLKNEGLPVDFTIPVEGTVPLIATLNVPKGSPNMEGALKFVNFFLEKTSQENWATGYSVGSIRSDIEVSDELRSKQITTKQDIEGLLLPDLNNITENLATWGERWQREVISQSN